MSWWQRAFGSAASRGIARPAASRPATGTVSHVMRTLSPKVTLFWWLAARRCRELLASRCSRAIRFGVGERGNMPTRSTFLFASLDAVLEWLAAVVGFCVFLSINYNITFFFGVRTQWLFFLTITDNVVAALYAIPQAFFAAMLFSCGAMIFGSTGPGVTRRLLLFWLLTAFVIISIVLVPVEERR